MTFQPLSLNNTYFEWLTTTNQIITNLNLNQNTAPLAYNTANVAFANGNTNFVVVQSAFGSANSGWLQANTARTHANAAFDQANTAFDQANTAFDQANTATAAAAPGFDQANTARTHANAAFGSANSGWLQANTARTHANAAFDQANTANNLTVANTGVVVGSRNILNFIPGANAKITFTDDGAGNRVNVSIDTTVTDSIPLGTVVDFAGTSAPSKWLFGFGQNVSRSTYAALFAILGTTYGAGDGSTTFGLPDFRGRVIAGKDDMGGTSANRITNQSGGLDGDVLGTTGGAETHTLTIAQMPSHDHTQATTGFTAGGGPHDVGGVNFAGNRVTGLTGGGGAHNNIQPTIILNKIIYAGV